MIDRGVRTQGGDHPERNAHGDGEERGEDGELGGGGQARGHFRGDRTPRADRSAEVALDDTADPQPVLHVRRLVEAEALADRLELGLGSVLAQHENGGVARSQIHDAEHDHGDAEKDRDQQEDTAEDVLEQLGSRPWPVARGATRMWRTACGTAAPATYRCAPRTTRRAPILRPGRYCLSTCQSLWWPAGCGSKPTMFCRTALFSIWVLRKIHGASSAMISCAS